MENENNVSDKSLKSVLEEIKNAISNTNMKGSDEIETDKTTYPINFASSEQNTSDILDIDNLSNTETQVKIKSTTKNVNQEDDNSAYDEENDTEEDEDDNSAYDEENDTEEDEDNDSAYDEENDTEDDEDNNSAYDEENDTEDDEDDNSSYDEENDTEDDEDDNSAYDEENDTEDDEDNDSENEYRENYRNTKYTPKGDLKSHDYQDTNSELNYDVLEKIDRNIIEKKNISQSKGISEKKILAQNKLSKKMKNNIINADSLLSKETTRLTEKEIKQLLQTALQKQSKPDDSQISLEDFITRLIKPELSSWLNSNLLNLVKEIVEKEIKKIIDNSKE